MVERVVTELVDDIDGAIADESVTFSVDGDQYEIDLSTANAVVLRAVLQPYIVAARRPTRPAARDRSSRLAAPFTGVDLAAVRAWASANGYTVSPTGRVAAAIVAAYRDAGY